MWWTLNEVEFDGEMQSESFGENLMIWLFFQKLGIVGVLEAKSDIFLRLHGAFMIGAWIGAASLGKTPV